MRKVLLTVSMLLIALSAFGEKVVGSYTATGREWEIRAGDINTELSILIEALGKYKGDKVYVRINGEETIEDFRASLLMMKSKFTEWKEVAKNNNVTKLSKKMDINFPKCEIYWLGSGKWYHSPKWRCINPLFMITETGTTVGLGGIAKHWDNEYIDQTWYVIFMSEEEIQGLYNATDPYEIRKVLNQTANTEDLFK